MSTEKRETIERNVAPRWQALQEAIAEERRHMRKGMVGSLLGAGDKKQGVPVPRKSREQSRPPGGDSGDDEGLVPNAKSENAMAKEKKPLDWEGQKMRLDSTSRRLNRSSTMPTTISEHAGAGVGAAKLKPLDLPNVPERPGAIEE